MNDDDAPALPRQPGFALEYDYLRAGAHRELVATCPRCRARQCTGLRLGDPVPEEVIARVKDRLLRYHSCGAGDFAALERMAGIEAVMDAFGFPDELRPPRPRRAPGQRRRGFPRE
ncbi:MAG: hypothetical protein ACKOT0_03920 [bacterium]